MNTPPSTPQPPSRAHWLTPQRVRIYSATILTASLIYLLRSAWHDWTLFGQPNGFDYAVFWVASRLTLDGTPLLAYSYESLSRVALTISPTIVKLGPWFYPPNFLLLVRPLALIPCQLGYPIFAITTTALFVMLMRRLAPMREAWWPILGFTGIWLNVAQGQNAALTATLVLLALVLLEKRPVLAGICIGLLSIKPHLAVLFPIALACGGMWVAFASAAVTATVFTAISVFVFGTAIIPVFLHGLALASWAVESGELPWQQTTSIFATLRALHVSVGPAYFVQACGAVAAVACVVWVWRRSRSPISRATSLIAGTLMTSPYLFNYDTIWLAIPIAMISVDSIRNGWLKGEREIVVAAWLYPAIGTLSGYLLHFGLGPFVFAALMFVPVRRTYREIKGLDATRSRSPGTAAAQYFSHRGSSL